MKALGQLRGNDLGSLKGPKKRASKNMKILIRGLIFFSFGLESFLANLRQPLARVAYFCTMSSSKGSSKGSSVGSTISRAASKFLMGSSDNVRRASYWRSQDEADHDPSAVATASQGFAPSVRSEQWLWGKYRACSAERPESCCVDPILRL